MLSRRSPSLVPCQRAAFTTALVAVLSGCATHELAHAPKSPDEPWRIPEDSKYVGALRQAASADSASVVQTGEPAASPARSAPQTTTDRNDDASAQNRVSLAVGRKYDLAELIDIAERHNPETRAAWEQARQAALAIGLAEHTYLPQLSANVLVGYQQTPFPVPKNVLPAGYFTAVTRELIPLLAVHWLLFDFGQREAQVQEAKANSFVANVTFTGAHQKIIYAVSRDYFALGAARAHVRVAARAAENARIAQDISEARHSQGVATVVEVAQTRRQSAQAHLDVVRASGAERSAYSALVASMGVEPTAPIEVADSSERPLPPAPMQEVRALVEEAIVRRPDVIAALGKLRAAEAGLRGANDSYWPKLDLSAQVYENVGGFSTDGSPYYSIRKPGANVLLGLDWPLFEGGAREEKVAIARSEVSAAHAALDGARDRAIEEVTHAYDQLQTSFAEYEAAMTVEQTADTALDAAIEAYRTGVGPLNDVITSENGAISAHLDKENARASVFSFAAALAFATGSIALR